MKKIITNRDMQVREALEGMDKIELFRTWCYTCFQVRFSKGKPRFRSFWKEVEIFLLAPIGLFVWLDFKLQKMMEDRQ